MPTAEERPLAHQLDPVLRELMAFDLVEKRIDDAGGACWVLTQAAQRRLTALDRPVPDQASMFFVGHRCDHCRDHTVTRRVASAHLCARCISELEAVGGVDADVRQEPA